MPPKLVCGNPLWRDWLIAEKQILDDKGSKAAGTYHKAITNLSKCPTKFDHPRELTVIGHIGPKMVDLLTRKWRIYCDGNDMDMPDTPAKSKKKAAPAAKRGKAKAPTPDEEEDEEEALAPLAKKPRKAAEPKRYVPQKGSGAYAILIALVLAIDEPDRCTQIFMTGDMIKKAAQPYSETSFTINLNNGHYSAWSGKKALLSNGLILSTGSPMKLALTQEGYEVARTLQSMLPDYAGMDPKKYPWIDDYAPALALQMTAPARPRPPPPDFALGRPGPSQQPASRPRTSQPGPERFQFWYIASDGHRVAAMTAAACRLDPETYLSLRKIEFKKSQRNHPFAKQLKLIDETAQVRDDSGEETLFGFTAEEGAPPQCSKFNDGIRVQSQDTGIGGSQKRRRGSMESELEIDLDDEDVGPSRPKPKQTPDQLFAGIGGSSTFNRTQSAPNPSGPRSHAQLAADAATRRLNALGPTASLSSLPTPKPAPPIPRPTGPRMSAHVPTRNPLIQEEEEDEPANMPNFDPSTAIKFPAGSYEIILIVDSREIESKTSRNEFSERLKAKGCRVEVRSLRLGDFIWIARRTDGLGGEDDECVLDYIVERKRLDDLRGSIKDGRYSEQCYRMGKSAIRNIYYIVEDFQVNANTHAEQLALTTAKSQIQVHNRMFLKETHKMAETIDFLATVTNVIKSLHARTDLHVIPSRYISRTTYPALQHKLRTPIPGDERSISSSKKRFLVGFEVFQQLNDKTKSQTIREKWGKMIMTIRGMGAEKAGVILEEWETPRSLWEEIKKHDEAPVIDDDEEDDGGKKKKAKKKVRGKDMFFADKFNGDHRKNIGDALSRTMYQTFMGGEN